MMRLLYLGIILDRTRVAMKVIHNPPVIQCFVSSGAASYQYYLDRIYEGTMERFRQALGTGSATKAPSHFWPKRFADQPHGITAPEVAVLHECFQHNLNDVLE